MKGRMSEQVARILNVNEREIPRYVSEELLRREGFEVVSVASGSAALAAAREGIDAVLLDVKLSDIDGYEVCRRLKADPETAGVIVLLSSATFLTAQSKVTGLDSGADGYLVQPYEAAELVATLRALLRTRAAERRAQALADELRAAVEVRDRFLAMLGHELRNPLSVMTTAIEVIEQRPDPETAQRYLAVLGRHAANLGRIVDDLLDVARLTRGKISLACERVDLRGVAERCVRDATRGAPLEVDLALPGEPVPVIGDVIRLEQIACNLVTNAIKYTPAGGRVWVRVGAAADRARLEVADTGIGIDAALLDRVFEVFVQGQQGLGRARGGLGLGLAVVRQLVALHGGTVAAYSEGEGRGSRFVVELPLAPTDVAADEGTAGAAGAIGSG